MRKPRIFGIRFRTFAVLFHPQTSQVIIVLSFFYQLCFKAILGSIETECLKIHIEPVETAVSYTTSDAADEEDSVDLGGRRIIKKKKYTHLTLPTNRIM